MNYTEKHHLPQWEESDRIMRTDFNQMCADIEAGLENSMSGAAEGDAIVAAAAQKAQAAADQAIANAAKAQAKADAAYAPDQPPYVVGTYAGTGAAQTITVGFRPSFLIIGAGYCSIHQHHIALGAGREDPRLSFTNTGFTVRPYAGTSPSSTNSEEAPYLSRKNATYCYIAFR